MIFKINRPLLIRTDVKGCRDLLLQGSDDWNSIILPEDGVEALLTYLQSAKKSIRCKHFKLIESTVIQALIAAQHRGVSVRVMLNPKRSDSSRVNDETVELLRNAGVDAEWTSPKFAVSHEKSIVVDDTYALIATFNVCPSCMVKVRDYGVITNNADIVAEIARCFDADWIREPFIPTENSLLLWSNDNSRVKMAAFIDETKDTLDIQHPKMVDSVILDRLLEAQARGVKIRFLCGGNSGLSSWDVLESLSAWRILRRSGIKIRIQKTPKLHAKLIVADKKKLLLSSLNIDRSAFDLRRELGVIVDNPAVVERLQQRFLLDWAKAQKYRIPDPLKATDKAKLSATEAYFQHE